MTFLKKLLITSALLLCTAMTFADDGSAGTGTVAETMTSAGYVYIRLEEDDAWLASNQIPVAVGDKVKYSNGMIMENFTSTSLNRTFSSIRFVEKLEIANEFSADDHAAAAAGDQHGFAKSGTAVAPLADEIKPLDGGITIADILTGAQQLTDQQVALRARVMKVSMNILGKNWITLQDGTGTAPDDKLVVTTSELVEVGDTVTAKGIVKTNVDIGAGYKYKVILEEATFAR